jgi:hypothetical protein
VTVDGAAAELPVKLPAGPALHTFVFKAPGFEPFEVRVDGTREHRSIFLNMKALAAPQRPSEKKPPSRPGAHRTGVPSATPSAAPPPPPAPPAPTPSKPAERRAKLITDF